MKRLSFWASLSVILMSFGCGKAVEEPQITPSVELTLKASISALQKSSQQNSTRVNSNGFEVEDRVGVYVSNKGTLLASGNIVDNIAFVYNNGTLRAENGETICWGSQSVRLNVYAYYPYAASIADNTAYPFSVAANQSTETAFYDSDFLTSSALNLAPQSTPVELDFNHSLSRINIALTAGADITQEELTSAAKTFAIDGFVLDGKVNLSNGKATVNTSSTATVTPLAVDGTNYSAIVYPQKGTLDFTLTMDGEIYTYSAEYDFKAGYQYLYTLKINARKPQQVECLSTTISVWQDGETTDGEMIDLISFNNDSFKNTMLNALHYEKPGMQGESKKVDANNDNEISIAEARAVSNLYISNLDVSNLDDLGLFPNMKTIVFDNAQLADCVMPALPDLIGLEVRNSTILSNIDFSECANIQDVAVFECPNIKSLSLENSTVLQSLKCERCGLSELDLSDNKELKTLVLIETYVRWVDLSNNLSLLYLECVNNYNMDKLDISMLLQLKTIVFHSLLPGATIYLPANSQGASYERADFGSNINMAVGPYGY